VRAKTGTLRNTAALAGVVTDQDGSSAAFVLMADRVALLKGTAAENALDAAAAALGGCHCSVGGAG
jgi:D-alanyl-D-alanine carboxypeptidase/D-alanyl-D-alanine-endopeptidase (penicillin-binding protein 4)